MKTLLLFAYIALLTGRSYCTPTGDEEINGVAEYDTYHDTESQTELMETKDDSTAKEQSAVSLTLTPGKAIVLKISPSDDQKKKNDKGIVYTRWGKTTCRDGAELVYAGRAGGSDHAEHGGGANLLCMPTTGVEHLSTVNPGHYSFVYGSEYQSHNKIMHNNEFNVPCAVCFVAEKSTQLMVPGRIECPKSWTQEYRGYVMTENRGHRRNAVFECIDEAGEKIPGTQGNTNGALLYFVMPKCDREIPCGPYNANIAITCSVCTR